MPDPTAQQLHDLISPLWEREPELRPDELYYAGGDQQWTYTLTKDMLVTSATQLCESQMVRWLTKDDDIGISRCVDGFVVDVQSLRPFGAPTFIQALAAACTAVLHAKEQEPTA